MTPYEEDRVRANITNDWCLNLPVYPGAQNGVAALVAVADVYIVTTSMGTRGWEEERRAWLWRHFEIDYKRVIFASAKYVCAGQYLIDDRSSHLIEWTSHHTNGRGILWRTPYNRTEEFYQTTNSWDDLHRWVSSYAAMVADP
jgi:5'(3')-deoxyribonucleotidase